jgi:deazaflavin-dependent oxidoreductase (nitroreductase family)
LWLTTVGRTSGIERTNALYYLEDGPSLVVVASNVGLDTDPAWWLNLQANPETIARTGRTVHRVRAREATPDERDRLWPRLVRLYPDYAAYARKTDRPIPIVILEPRPDG